MKNLKWKTFLDKSPSVSLKTWLHLTLFITVYVFVCVCVSQLYEEVRKSLEQCDVQEDIEHFINLRRTGDKPPGINSGMFINN